MITQHRKLKLKRICMKCGVNMLHLCGEFVCPNDKKRLKRLNVKSKQGGKTKWITKTKCH